MGEDILKPSPRQSLKSMYGPLHARTRQLTPSTVYQIVELVRETDQPLAIDPDLHHAVILDAIAPEHLPPAQTMSGGRIASANASTKTNTTTDALKNKMWTKRMRTNTAAAGESMTAIGLLAHSEIPVENVVSTVDDQGLSIRMKSWISR